MDFLIRFTTLKSEGKLLDKTAILTYNLKTLDDVRMKLNLPDIPSEKIFFTQKVDFCKSTYEVKVTEKIARQIPQLQNNYYVKVLIPDNFLKPYQTLNCKVVDWKQTTLDRMFKRKGTATAIEVVTEIDDVRLIKDWISNNCPIRWNTSEDI
jgi:hypothetical protein